MATVLAASGSHRVAARPGVALGRAVLLGALLGGAAAGLLITAAPAQEAAVATAGADLTRLLRAMAAIKALMAAAAVAAVFWRAAVPMGVARLGACAAACAAMAAGPGLIWTMAHVGLGALLLHGGLVAAIVLLWRDPAVSARLAEIVKARRAALAVPAPYSKS